MINGINYSLLLEKMYGTRKNDKPSWAISVDSLSESSVRKQLQAAGIDINSKQFKVVVKSIRESAGGKTAYTNIQAIKNRMSQYDKDGDYIDPTTGLAGLVVIDKNRADKNRIINISERSREEMFELTKKEFLRENGVCNGDTTKRSDVYTNLYRETEKKDRLAAGHTMQQYERAYRQAFVEAAKRADPQWEVGKPIKSGALDGITRKEIDDNLIKVGDKLERKTVNCTI